jgi:hypothetical protein
MIHEPLPSPHYPSPPDPQYEDVLRVTQLVIKDHNETLRFLSMQKAHPEISRFFVTSDGLRRLVLFRDGRVEAYGGPGEPGFEVMDARYAPLPWYMTNVYQQAPRRPSPWQETARRLQQDFQPVPTDARAIVFPGDSQVLVITASGETELYRLIDIDGMSNPRSAFEARFGRLPDYVPVAVRRPGTHDYEIVHPASAGNASYETHYVKCVESIHVVREIEFSETQKDTGPGA